MKGTFTLLIMLLSAAELTAQQTVGLFSRTPASQDGYVLFAPVSSNTTYLIDKCGKSVHTWTSTHKPGQSVYLLEDGSLLRPANANNTTFTSGGTGGIIERMDWNGSLLWSYAISSASECQHHDVCRLPNGNILAIAWESKTSTEAISAGRAPAQVGSSLWSEKIVELQPAGTNAATIVWEWHVWDHLVQEQDNSKPNYGIVSQHPELINLNYTSGNPTAADWLHINSVAYNPALNQIMLSVHNFSELWVIDHSTTTAQAASHTGGVHGKGGDLLYRWGNPVTYGRGTAADRIFYTQHNAHWIESGLPDGGRIMVFNNGTGRPGGNYSSIDLFVPPVDASGNYAISGGAAYGPSALSWQYKAPIPTDFFSQNISGAQRLSSGNTLICEGADGHFFEVDNAGNTVWKYVNPVNLSGPVSQGTTAAMNAVFRCTQYAAGYAGFSGRTLTPAAPVEQNPLAYNCLMGTTAVALTHAGDALTVANPFADNLLLRAAADMHDISITLTTMTGAVCQSWQAVQFRAGEVERLSIDRDLPGGLYVLQLNAAGFRKTIKLLH